MKDKNNGGPAFPSLEEHGLNNGCYGMTLRDYFAANAPAIPTTVFFPHKMVKRVVIKDTGFGPNRYRENIEEVMESELDRTVRWNTSYADAMISERTAP